MTVIDSRVVLAPMAGGPGTVALAAAAATAGAFPFIPGAYLNPERLAEDIRSLRAKVRGTAYGINLFVPQRERAGDLADAMAYAARLQPWAAKAGVTLGEPHDDDDRFREKVEVVVRERVPVVSFSFAWPSAEVVELLRAAGSEVWVTLNDATEVEWAETLGVTGIVAQGWEAGGHRGGPVDSLSPERPTQPSTSVLLHEVRTLTDLPVLAAGGVMDGAHLAALVAEGAHAVACGTAYLCAHEAGTSEVHRHALQHRSGTVVTRAFTGRSARALTTTWTEVFGDGAPAAYPHVSHVTAPLRIHGRVTGQEDLVHLWAGTGHAQARIAPAAEITQRLLTPA